MKRILLAWSAILLMLPLVTNSAPKGKSKTKKNKKASPVSQSRLVPKPSPTPAAPLPLPSSSPSPEAPPEGFEPAEDFKIEAIIDPAEDKPEDFVPAPMEEIIYDEPAPPEFKPEFKAKGFALSDSHLEESVGYDPCTAPLILEVQSRKLGLSLLEGMPVETCQQMGRNVPAHLERECFNGKPVLCAFWPNAPLAYPSPGASPEPTPPEMRGASRRVGICAVNPRTMQYETSFGYKLTPRYESLYVFTATRKNLIEASHWKMDQWECHPDETHFPGPPATPSRLDCKFSFAAYIKGGSIMRSHVKYADNAPTAAGKLIHWRGMEALAVCAEAYPQIKAWFLTPTPAPTLEPQPGLVTPSPSASP